MPQQWASDDTTTGADQQSTSDDYTLTDRLLTAGFVLFLALIVAGAIVLGER